MYSEDLHQQQTWTYTHTDRDSYTRTSHTEAHALPQLTRTHTQTETHIHADIDTHTQRPTHYLNSLDLTLHTAHLTDNSHSDFLRDEKCFRATRRLVSLFSDYFYFGIRVLRRRLSKPSGRPFSGFAPGTWLAVWRCLEWLSEHGAMEKGQARAYCKGLPSKQIRNLQLRCKLCQTI